MRIFVFCSKPYHDQRTISKPVVLIRGVCKELEEIAGLRCRIRQISVPAHGRVIRAEDGEDDQDGDAIGDPSAEAVFGDEGHNADGGAFVLIRVPEI